MDTSIRAKYEAFIESAIANKKAVFIFYCPHCRNDISTLAAPPGAVWDSLSTCPYCEGMFMKITTGNGVRTAVVNDDSTITWG